MPHTDRTPRKTSRLSSLSATLIIPYISLLLLLTLTLTGLFYWSGTRAVAGLSDQLLQEMVQRIKLTVDQHMNGSSAVLEVAFPSGLAAPESVATDWDSLYRRFWAATAIHTNPNDYVYYGNLAGQGFGLKRLTDQDVELRVKTRAQDHRQYYLVQGINGKPLPAHLEPTLFDPRTRPWFTRGQQASHHTWTAVYINYGVRDLVVTRARRVLSDKGEFEGVVATDVSLHALEALMHSLPLTANGHAFILEPQGQLIASSRVASLRDDNEGKLTRVYAQDGSDPVILSVYQSIRHIFDEPSSQQPASIRTTTLNGPNGETLHVALTRIRDNAGLDWIAAVTVPSSDILGGINRILIGSLLLGLLATGLLVFIGLRFFHRVAADIAKLSYATRRVGLGELDVGLHIDRNDEVGDLARSFKAMHSDLFTDRLTGLANRSALMQQLQAMLDRPAAAADPFALLFIDLNDFKPLNDDHGHDNGDQALREVAQRLRQAVRGEDLVSRLGGDEFVILLRHVQDRNTAVAISEQVRHALRAPLRTLRLETSNAVQIGCAIGIALFPEDGLDPAALLNCADQDMYRDKKTQGAGR